MQDNIRISDAADCK